MYPGADSNCVIEVQEEWWEQMLWLCFQHFDWWLEIKTTAAIAGNAIDWVLTAFSIFRKQTFEVACYQSYFNHCFVFYQATDIDIGGSEFLMEF